MAKSIAQTVVIDATPKRVFEALVNSRTHAQFTGAPARVSRKAGALFTAYDGYATGRNIEVIVNKRIVQGWRAKDWPHGVYSLATFALAPVSGGKTQITFTQHGVPDEQLKSMRDGWPQFYWRPLQTLFTKRVATDK